MIKTVKCLIEIIIMVKFFSSPELKAQVSFSDRLSSVCLSVRLSVSFPIFVFFSRPTGPILTKLGTKHPWVKVIQVCSNEGHRPFPRGDNYEIAKNTLTKLKKFSSPEPLRQF